MNTCFVHSVFLPHFRCCNVTPNCLLKIFTCQPYIFFLRTVYRKSISIKVNRYIIAKTALLKYFIYTVKTCPFHSLVELTICFRFCVTLLYEINFLIISLRGGKKALSFGYPENGTVKGVVKTNSSFIFVFVTLLIDAPE